MNGNKGQAMIMGLVFLVMTIIVFTAFIPVISNTISDSRNYDSLNCRSSQYICGDTVTLTETAESGVWCYNATRETETTSCLIFDIYLPYIVIAVLIGGVGLIIGGRAMGMGAPAQPAYGY